MEKTEKSVATGIIVMEIRYEGETVILGGLADSVQQVIELDSAHIEPAPRIGTRIDTHFIKGMGKHEDNFLIILDIDKVFTSTELTQVSEKTGASVTA